MSYLEPLNITLPENEALSIKYIKIDERFRNLDTLKLKCKQIINWQEQDLKSIFLKINEYIDGALQLMAVVRSHDSYYLLENYSELKYHINSIRKIQQTFNSLESSIIERTEKAISMLNSLEIVLNNISIPADEYRSRKHYEFEIKEIQAVIIRRSDKLFQNLNQLVSLERRFHELIEEVMIQVHSLEQ